MYEDEVRSNPGGGFVMQPWLSALYPLTVLWDLYLEYGDVPLGPEAISISRIFTGFERFVWTINARIPPGGDGTAAGPMANLYSNTWSGARIGGTYLTNDWVYIDSDYLLYPESKSALVGALFRAAALRNMDTRILRKAEEMESLALGNPPGSRSWDKLTGEQYQGLIAGATYLSPRIAGSVAYPGFQPGAVVVVAVATSNSWSTNLNTVTEPGAAYAFVTLPYDTNYWIRAFVDRNSNGVWDAAEAWGAWTGGIVALTAGVSGVAIALADPDGDLDALPDWWESEFFGITNALSNDDPDRDGFSNLAEYRAGTDPHSAASALALRSVNGPSAPGFVLQWPSAWARTYGIQIATDQVTGLEAAISNIAATPPINTYTATVPPGASRAFYRVTTP